MQHQGPSAEQQAERDDFDNEDVGSPEEHNNDYEFGDDESAGPDDIRERDLETKIANLMDDGNYTKAYKLLKDLETMNDSKPVCI